MTLAQVFSCEFYKSFKNTFFTEYLWATASVLSSSWCHSNYVTMLYFHLFEFLQFPWKLSFQHFLFFIFAIIPFMFRIVVDLFLFPEKKKLFRFLVSAFSFQFTFFRFSSRFTSLCYSSSCSLLEERYRCTLWWKCTLVGVDVQLAPFTLSSSSLSRLSSFPCHISRASSWYLCNLEKQQGISFYLLLAESRSISLLLPTVLQS